MLRILGTVIGIFSTATVLTGLLVALYSWGQGHLTRSSVREVVAIVKGEPRPEVVEEEPEERKSSYEQIIRNRTEKILSISARESELDVLKSSLDEQAELVMSERKKIGELRKEFREELAAERKKIKDEAVAQARGILLRMETESSVEKLLALDVEDAVYLLKGMAEKDAARILDQFRERIAGKDPGSRVEKAEEIYKAIYRGEPLIEPANEARQALRDQPQDDLATQ